MNIQWIVVGLIGLAVVAKVGYEIYKFFFVKRDDSSYCGGCPSCGEVKKELRSPAHHESR
ncbi:FeoB-associated Cys-rich membrane protein [Limibacterium fermenti]|uniref:FeoB-associated Cys-rich membrane protein n=1 Tax=Limibacterium fermenti TaxID=3229863 RepID=UPI000E8C77F8|nr:FeoB-associated Cys-rich membrane protein [Porphyromonadaceae bacterium]